MNIYTLIILAFLSLYSLNLQAKNELNGTTGTIISHSNTLPFTDSLQEMGKRDALKTTAAGVKDSTTIFIPAPGKIDKSKVKN